MKYVYKTVSVPIVFLDGWLVNLEKSCFGWKKDGEHDESYEYDEHSTRNYTEYHDGVEWDVTEHTTERKTGWRTYQDFYRVSPFTFNPIFAIFEWLSGIFSFIRRLVMSLARYIIIPLIVLVVIAAILDPAMLTDGLYVIGGIAALYIGLVVVPSVLIALIALAMRKLFGIDKHLADNLRANGYSVDW
ncbi:MAG: hypothetical protein IKC87_03170 [Clostridia bacterium]|nr:hypothetical protein [Clostridia bacterium]